MSKGSPIVICKVLMISFRSILVPDMENNPDRYYSYYYRTAFRHTLPFYRVYFLPLLIYRVYNLLTAYPQNAFLQRSPKKGLNQKLYYTNYVKYPLISIIKCPCFLI